MVSVDYSEAMVEILDILDHSEDDIRKRIPAKLINFWNENKSKTYKPQLDHSKPIKEMGIKKKTKTIIAMIYLNYLCDGKEKEELKKQMIKNDEAVKEKYDAAKLFENQKMEVAKENVANMEMVEYKEPFFKKIINKIKGFFK